MRALLLTLALLATAAAQSASVPTISVTDENGVAVASARVFLQSPPLPAVRCQTDFSGRCQFPALPPGQYQLRVEKEGFYALLEPGVQITPSSAIEVSISHQQEVHEIVDVHESPPAIDPAQITAQETISGLDVLNIVYPVTHDYRNALNFIPGVVQDQSWPAPHCRSPDLPDRHPARRFQRDPTRQRTAPGSRQHRRFPLHSGRALARTRRKRQRFWRPAQTQHRHRRRPLPLLRHRFSSLRPKQAWMALRPVPPALHLLRPDSRRERRGSTTPSTANTTTSSTPNFPPTPTTTYILRFGNLTKLQTNLTSRNILTTSFLVNHLHDPVRLPLAAEPATGESERCGIRLRRQRQGPALFRRRPTPRNRIRLRSIQRATHSLRHDFLTSSIPTPRAETYYLADQTHARRWQALTNLFLPPRQWHGRHDFKVGVDLDRISYDAEFARQPISFLSGDQHSALHFAGPLPHRGPGRQLPLYPLLHLRPRPAASSNTTPRSAPMPKIAGSSPIACSSHPAFASTGTKSSATPSSRPASPEPTSSTVPATPNSPPASASSTTPRPSSSSPAPTPEPGRTLFYSTPAPTCTANCVTTTGPVTTTFTVNNARSRSRASSTGASASKRNSPPPSI